MGKVDRRMRRMQKRGMRGETDEGKGMDNNRPWNRRKKENGRNRKQNKSLNETWMVFSFLFCFSGETSFIRKSTRIPLNTGTTTP